MAGRYMGNWYPTPEFKLDDRVKTAERMQVRGTSKTPLAPQDLSVQSGPRGILVNWRPAPGRTEDIAGWRVYKDDESSLFAEIRDPGTTQHFIEATAGTTPPVTNVFVSSINKLNQESPRVQVQGAALAETGAPSMPSTPPTYTNNYTGGAGTGGKRGFQGQ